MLPRTRAPVVALAAAVLGLIGLLGLSLWLGLKPLLQDQHLPVIIGGPFSLTNHRGERITEKTFLGKPTLYFFGFTHCPEVCPTSLMEMTGLLKELGPDANRINAVFVSLDPERDTKTLIATYLESFDSRIVGATGSAEEIADIARKFRVYYRKVEEGENYTIDHTATIYVMDREGGLAALIDYKEDQASALRKIKRLL